MATAPDGLSDLVHWLNADDAATIVDAGSDGDVDQWLDMSGAANHASQGTSGSQPQIVSSGINGRTAIGFDGADDRLDVADDATLNTGGPYSGKTLMMAFRTGNDVSGRQVLYEQGGSSRGLNFYVDNGQIYLNGWNLAETAWGPSFANSAVSPNTTYIATFVFDQAAGTVEGFVDGSSIGSVSGVGFLNGHTGDIALGAVNGGTLFHDGTSSTSSNTFSGLIGEFVQYNQALPDVDRAGVEAYLQDRWQGVANQLPTAGDDSGSTTEDSAVTITVLDNDTDSDGGSPTVSGVDTAGTVGSVTNNGSDVTYDPNGGFESLGAGVTATDTFKYTIADGQGGTDTATVTVTVTGLNDAPVAMDDNGSTDKETPFTTANVLTNDSDPDGPSALSVTGFDTTGTLGQVTNNGDGTFDYNPNGQFDGLAGGASATDTFTYMVSDGGTGTDTATVTVTVTSGIPGTAPDSVSDLVLWLDADDGATITDTGNDGDVDLWSDKSGQGNHASETTSGSQPTIDAAGINGRTAIGFDGSNDGLDVADDATLNTGGPYTGKTLMMAFRTGSDVAGRQVLYEQGGQTRGISFYILNGELYLNGWNLAETVWGPSFAKAAVTANTTYIATFVIDQAAGTVEGFLDGASIGSVSGVSFLNSHGQNIGIGAARQDTRFHDGSSSGDDHTFDGRIGEFVQYNKALTDVEQAGVEAYLQSRWQGVANQLPTAGDDSDSTTEDSAVTIAVLANDTDSDGGSPTVSGVNTAGTTGSVTNNGSDVTYDPNGGFENLAAGVTATDTFEYTLADGQGGTDTATVTVTVTGINDAPVASDDSGSTDKETTFTTANVLTNDSDPDGPSALSVTGFDTTGTLGQVTNNGDGTFDYDPNGQFDSLGSGGSATDTFTYTVSDGGTGTDTATVTVTVTGVANQPPDAVDDNAVATEGFSTAGIDVLANDSDPEDGSAVIYVGSDVTGTVGNVTDHGDGTFTYDAQGLFESLSNGATTTDSFTYTIEDSGGLTDTATVTVVVSGDNDQPDAVDDTATVAWDAALGSIDVLVNDSDIDSADTLSVTGFDVTGTLGQVSNNGGGTFSYDPNGAFDGLGAGVSATDTFTYTIGDAQGGSDTATVTVTVNGGTVVAGTAPDSVSDLVQWLDADDGTTITDTGNDGDVDLWSDKSGQGNHASETTSGSQPSIDAGGINGRTAIGFDGSNDGLDVADDATLNTGGPYAGKTLMMAFRTGSDVTGRQVLYEQGGGTRGINFYILNGELYLNGWNLAETVWGPSFAKAAVTANTTYVATFVIDQAAGTVEGFLDGASIGSVSGVSFLNSHGQNIGVGAARQDTRFHDGSDGGDGHTFDGRIGEFAQYNKALTDVERAGVEAYMQSRWQGVANLSPTAGDDSGSTNEDTPTVIDVLANDTDTDGGTPSVQAVDASGTVGSVTNNGSDVTYDPNGGFDSLGAGVTATDTFKYTVADGQGGTDTATVTITVTGINDAPVATDDNGSTDKASSFTTANVLANDSDPDGPNTLSVAGLVNSSVGQVINNGDGTFDYNPNEQFNGLSGGATATDTFTYKVTDGNGGSDTATVTVTITSGTMGTAPGSVSDLVLWLDADDGATITDTGSDGDVDQWSDKSGQGNHASETTSGSQPAIVAAGINSRTAIGFDGSNDGLDVADDATLNTGGPYSGKTLMMAFRTGADVNSRQVLYEQGGVNRGLNFYIDNGELYLNGWNVFETAWGPSFAKATITANTTYVATFVFDQVASTVEGFVDGSSIGSVSGVSFLNSHSQNIGIGATRDSTRFHDGSFSGDGYSFDGRIGELLQYNRALTDVEQSGVEAYLFDRWGVIPTPFSINIGDLDGSNGFVVNGRDDENESRSGSQVAGLGDVNGDGIDDFAVRAHRIYPPPPSEEAPNLAGESNVIVYGFPGIGNPNPLELNDIDEASGAVVDTGGGGGIDIAGGPLGTGIGDINGDGFDDVLVSNHQFGYGDNSLRIAFGSPNLGAENGNIGFANKGFDLEIYGRLLASVGDLNNDGFDDFFVGGSYIIYGNTNIGDSGFIDPSQLSTSERLLITSGSGGTRRISAIDAGDVNGDGFSDVLIANDEATNVGLFTEVVIFGGSDVGSNGTIDIDLLDGSDGFGITGSAAGQYSTERISGAGDINGDGFDDFVVTNPEQNIYGAPSGVAYIVFGDTNIGQEGPLDLENLDGTNGFQFRNFDLSFQMGDEIGAIGDFNRDGFDDLVFSSHRLSNDTPNQVHVLFGDQNVGQGGVVTSYNLDGTNGFAITGEDPDGNFGWSVDGAGDVNEDGFDDIIVGERLFNPDGRSYVIFGHATADTISTPHALSETAIIAVEGLSDVVSGNLLDNDDDPVPGPSPLSVTTAGVFAGQFGSFNISANGNFSYTVDVNQPAVDDLIFGESIFDTLEYTITDGADQSTAELSVRIDGGRGRVSAIDLDELNGEIGFDLNGIDANDRSGAAVADAGDVNGDGFEDFIVGAFAADPGGDSRAGEAYVLFGKATGYASSFDLGSLNGTNGFRLDGIAVDDFAGGIVDAAGDVNGDGFGDILISATGATADGDADAGNAYLIFGGNSGFPSSIDLATLNGIDGVRFDGIEAGDNAGSWLSGIGDLNGDGLSDIIISASAADADGKSDAGESYVIFGRTDGFGANFDLSALDGSNGFRLDGEAIDDHAGVLTSAAGDINGDGLQDVIIGASGADADAGRSYVLFGSANGFAADLNLSSLDGTNGFRLDGITGGDLSGASVAGVGDINGDNFDDLAIGANGADGGAGRTYVVYGKQAGFNAVLDLASLDGSNGFRLDGIDGDDQSGRAIGGAGDFNGDGFDDLLIGAFQGDPGGDNDAGEAYIMFGCSTGFDATIDLSTLNGFNGLRLDGIDAEDAAGRAVSAAGDVNGDGFDDVIVGAGSADPNGDNDAGESYVIFGFNTTGAEVGSDGNDLLTGGNGTNSAIGGRGNDTISGANVSIGGSGDDQINISDIDFRRIDGGSGNDKIMLSGSTMTLDLTDPTLGSIRDLEAIDLNGSSNELQLDALDLANLSSHSNTLTVTGDATNGVSANFAGLGFVLSQSNGFDEYSNGILTLRVVEDVDNSNVLIA